MGFFSKIFGSAEPNSSSQPVRAQHKNIKYFENELERIDLWMQDDDEDFQRYKEKNGSLENHHYIEACSIRLQKIQLIYSKGGELEAIFPILDEAITFLLQADPKEFKNNSLFLKCCSLLFLLNKLQDHYPGIQTFINIWENSDTEPAFKPVNLIYFIVGLERKDKSTNDYRPFVLLQDIISLPDKEAELAIKQYLKNWYAMHKEEAWYNSHLREWGYCGYWAFEVAAVVKRMGLDENTFKDSVYYPYDMVHWK
ncbi:PoNe immunity protein domain-containing protein [Sphingobacterium sp.]|uniref:PoNe immunity protein domain-containing protein n=1 Tax=Sphingobacterium sp. TaxID=341027 RepID=UPI0031DFD668